MPFEIELKAHLDDSAPVKKRLSTTGDYLRSYKKSDSYWYAKQISLPGIPAVPEIRVRRECGSNINGKTLKTTLVTYKNKEISDDIEINNEREFTISDAGPFEELLISFGMHRAICKEKEGWAWAIKAETEGQTPILAELSMVKELGWYLELEILAASNDKKTVEESRKRLLEALEKLEIPVEQIETRPYTVMLREKGKGAH